MTCGATCPASVRRRCTSRSSRRSIACRRPTSSPLGSADAGARHGQRRARGEAEGQGDRQLARRARHAHGDRARSRRCSSSTATHLPMLFIVSDLTLQPRARPTAPTSMRVEVDKARGVKCDRCWRYVPSVRTEPDWSGICDRCVDALAEPVNSLTVTVTSAPARALDRRRRRRARSGRQGARARHSRSTRA